MRWPYALLALAEVGGIAVQSWSAVKQTKQAERMEQSDKRIEQLERELARLHAKRRRGRK